MQQALLVHRLLIPIWSLPMHLRLVYRQCSIETRFSINRPIIGYLKLCKLCISFVNGEIERRRKWENCYWLTNYPSSNKKRLRRFERNHFNNSSFLLRVPQTDYCNFCEAECSQRLIQSIYLNSNNLNLKFSD